MLDLNSVALGPEFYLLILHLNKKIEIYSTHDNLVLSNFSSNGTTLFTNQCACLQNFNQSVMTSYLTRTAEKWNRK